MPAVTRLLWHSDLYFYLSLFFPISFLFFFCLSFRPLQFIHGLSTFFFISYQIFPIYYLSLSEFLRRSLMIFIVQGFRTIVFIFIEISITFRLICPPAFKCLSNSGTYTELRTTSFIESMEVACSDSVSHNRVPVLSIPVLLLTCSQNLTCNLQMIVSLEDYGSCWTHRVTVIGVGSQSF